MKILPNLTGLRFVLASLVVIFHISEFCENRKFPFSDLSVFNKGQEAVCMFFSLSGFLIIRQLYIEKSVSNSINLWNFFRKRILRILPLYYFVLSFGLLYYRIILPNFGFEFESNYNLMHGILLTFSVFPNIFAVQKPGGIIEILWSIGIEEQFYLVIAPLFFVLPFKNIGRFLLVFTIGYFAFYFSVFSDFLRSFRMLFFYFSFSGMCSVLLLKGKMKIQKFKYLIATLFLVYFLTSIFEDNFSNVIYHLFSMLLFGFMLCVFVENPTKLLENKMLNHLGKISYGIYMYHAIMMQIVGFLYLKSNIYLEVSGSFSIILFNVLVFVFTIFTADLSYRYFESYFLKLKNKSL